MSLALSLLDGIVSADADSSVCKSIGAIFDHLPAYSNSTPEVSGSRGDGDSGTDSRAKGLSLVFPWVHKEMKEPSLWRDLG